MPSIENPNSLDLKKISPPNQINSQKLWHMYGNTYDLSTFLKKHPGGQQILYITQGHQDITPMFESYHAFADLDRLKKELSNYEVGKSEYAQKYTFEKGEFYDVVRDRVRKYFGTAKNVNAKVKINTFWIIKSFLITLFYLLNTYMAFVHPDVETLQACVHAMIAGTCVIAVGMCVFHDSSHFGLFRKNIAGNDVFTRVFGALLMWRSEMWMMHHSFRHHTYTGDENLDPDVMNYHPIVRKTDRIDRKRVLNFPFNIIPYLITYFLWIFPGQCIGQSLVYWIVWLQRGHVWKMSLPNREKVMNHRKTYENVILFLVIFMHFYRFNFWISASYLIAMNISYTLAIVPDHDTNETHKNFDASKKDWGETQVRNSGNQGNGQFFDLYNHIFGGINYQIEHHLFPSMNSVHLNKIAPIVKMTCKEFNVPYVSHPNIGAAYVDFLKSVNNVAIKEEHEN